MNACIQHSQCPGPRSHSHSRCNRFSRFDFRALFYYLRIHFNVAVGLLNISSFVGFLYYANSSGKRNSDKCHFVRVTKVFPHAATISQTRLTSMYPKHQRNLCQSNGINALTTSPVHLYRYIERWKNEYHIIISWTRTNERRLEKA